MLPPGIKIVEVGPRDGLQNESRVLSTAVRGGLIRLLAAAGLKSIEVGGFMAPQHLFYPPSTTQSANASNHYQASG